MTHVEVSQERLIHDLGAVAYGVTGNAEGIDRPEGCFDRFEANFGRL